MITMSSVEGWNWPEPMMSIRSDRCALHPASEKDASARGSGQLAPRQPALPRLQPAEPLGEGAARRHAAEPALDVGQLLQVAAGERGDRAELAPVAAQHPA